jgi:hypothetical protein
MIFALKFGLTSYINIIKKMIYQIASFKACGILNIKFKYM